MTRPPEQRLLTEANAAAYAADPLTPIGGAITAAAAAAAGAVAPPYGAAVDRPVAPASGEPFFDSTLGKPVWWNGAAWVDATGATV